MYNAANDPYAPAQTQQYGRQNSQPTNQQWGGGGQSQVQGSPWAPPQQNNQFGQLQQQQQMAQLGAQLPNMNLGSLASGSSGSSGGGGGGGILSLLGGLF
jgi:hypothetical protein